MFIKNSSCFSQLLQIQVDSRVATARSVYHITKDKEAKRTIAVACMLELIKSEVANSEISNLEYFIEKLPHFTDVIQKSLEVNK
ncbi:hypothetical protein [Photobacterium sp. 1_MG-2023]|uniref:hypothetical protein n=1 Tax=Photobacterium sp. 1_MG-2023 TaxID=3062646 RepID=UPI0026E382BE|nr:hypothetical protein [Photobacterium sp. 1_MG-2023]MDO6705110.1 hypothetical protein [Photobacterium sp. 1_MG-2023]